MFQVTKQGLRWLRRALKRITKIPSQVIEPIVGMVKDDLHSEAKPSEYVKGTVLQSIEDFDTEILLAGLLGNSATAFNDHELNCTALVRVGYYAHYVSFRNNFRVSRDSMATRHILESKRYGQPIS